METPNFVLSLVIGLALLQSSLGIIPGYICGVNDGTTDTCTHGDSACHLGMFCSDVSKDCSDGPSSYRVCTLKPCDEDGDCPANYECRKPHWTKFCLSPANCDNSKPCPKGYQCRGGAQKGCVQKCDLRDASTCPAEYTCKGQWWPYCVPDNQCDHPCPQSWSWWR